MTDKYIVMDRRLADYMDLVSVREHPVLARLREATSPLRQSMMQIAPGQGQFMALLVELIGARRCLEIGVFTGYSALAVALALPEDGRIVALDRSVDWTTMARRYWAEAGVAGKIELRLGDAADGLDRLLAEGAAGSFDFAFIDADKERYDLYYERALALVRDGGLIAIDNVLWSGAVADPTTDDADTESLRALNAKLHDDPRVSLAMVTIGDGLTLARKRPSAR